MVLKEHIFLLLQATGLTGLKVAQHPHHDLTVLYNKILKTLAKMPQNAAYRIHTEKLIKDRADIVVAVSILII